MSITHVSQTIPKEDKKDLIEKLKRIEGRVRGLSTMVDDERPVEDIMMQVTASYEALRVVTKRLIKRHLQDAISKGLISTNEDKRNEAYEKLLNDIFKYVR